MQSSRTMMENGQRRGEEWEARLSAAWVALSNGEGSRDDFEIVLTDLAEQSEYYFISPPGTPGEELIRREGKREMMSRILYLLDRPTSFMHELRKASLDELTVSILEGE